MLAVSFGGFSTDLDRRVGHSLAGIWIDKNLVFYWAIAGIMLGYLFIVVDVQADAHGHDPDIDVLFLPVVHQLLASLQRLLVVAVRPERLGNDVLRGRVGGQLGKGLQYVDPSELKLSFLIFAAGLLLGYCWRTCSSSPVSSGSCSAVASSTTSGSSEDSSWLASSSSSLLEDSEPPASLAAEASSPPNRSGLSPVPGSMVDACVWVASSSASVSLAPSVSLADGAVMAST